MLIYCKEITPRIEYIFLLLLTDILGVNITFTDDYEEFILQPGPKINYSSLRTNEGVYIEPVELLFQSTITEQHIEVFEYNGVKAFFKVSGEYGIPFDLFAASFYLISRYEEYLPYKSDKHDRFQANESLAFKHNFLLQPVVNLWLEDFKKILLKHYPQLQFKLNNYQYISTVDVDNGYAYLGKSWWRSIGAFVKYSFKLDLISIKERLMVLSGLKKDPFDQYELQRGIQKYYKLSLIYFLLCCKPGKNDHNILPKGKQFKKILNTLVEFGQIGIHPSYKSSKQPKRIKVEKELLEEIYGSKINKSRQHFLRMTFPDTYTALIEAGIKEDYSMGYASHPGFRAGICVPFKFYNLKEEKTTALTIYPFVIMDITLIDYLKIKTCDAINLIIPLINQVKKVNGLFISVWHDRTFSNSKQYKGWNKVYEEMVKIAN